MDKLFQELLQVIETIRPGYRATLGSGTDRNTMSNIIGRDVVPDLIYSIYSQVNGTDGQIQDQKFMDLVPGYRILQLSELSERRDRIYAMAPWVKSEDIIPVLANYSDDYLCLRMAETSGDLVDFTHDMDEIQMMYDSSESFLHSVKECYEKGAYFLDEDQYLECDDDAEAVVGKKYNPNAEFWDEDE